MHDNYLTHKAPLYIDVRDRDHMTVSVSHRPVFGVQSIKCMKKKKKLNGQVIFKIYQRHVQKLISFNFSSFYIYKKVCPTKANASLTGYTYT